MTRPERVTRSVFGLDSDASECCVGRTWGIRRLGRQVSGIVVPPVAVLYLVAVHVTVCTAARPVIACGAGGGTGPRAASCRCVRWDRDAALAPEGMRVATSAAVGPQFAATAAASAGLCGVAEHPLGRGLRKCSLRRLQHPPACINHPLACTVQIMMITDRLPCFSCAALQCSESWRVSHTSSCHHMDTLTDLQVPSLTT